MTIWFSHCESNKKKVKNENQSKVVIFYYFIRVSFKGIKNNSNSRVSLSTAIIWNRRGWNRIYLWNKKKVLLAYKVRVGKVMILLFQSELWESYYSIFEVHYHPVSFGSIVLISMKINIMKREDQINCNWEGENDMNIKITYTFCPTINWLLCMRFQSLSQ